MHLKYLSGSKRSVSGITDLKQGQEVQNSEPDRMVV